MRAGACRYDTEGYVTEHISQEEEAYAAARLDKIRRQNRIKAELHVNTVIHLCDTYNIPFATNLATAELLVKALDRGDLEWREVLRKEGLAE